MPVRLKQTRSAEPVVVRCTHEGKIYEVEYRGDDPVAISHLCHRTHRGRLTELRYSVWRRGKWSWFPCDEEILAAARRARRMDPMLALLREKEAELAQVRRRRDALLKKIEKFDVMIKQMQSAGVEAVQS